MTSADPKPVRRPTRAVALPVMTPPGPPPVGDPRLVTYRPAPGDEMVARLSDRLRSAYFSAARLAKNDSNYGNRAIAAFDGGTSRSGRVYQPIWPRFLDVFMRNRVDGVWYFEHQMRPADQQFVFVDAFTAMASSRIDAYLADTEFRLLRLRRIWETERRRLEEALRRPRCAADGDDDSPELRVANVRFGDPLAAYTFRAQYGIQSSERALRSAALAYTINLEDYRELDYVPTAELADLAIRLFAEITQALRQTRQSGSGSQE